MIKGRDKGRERNYKSYIKYAHGEKSRQTGPFRGGGGGQYDIQTKIKTPLASPVGTHVGLAYVARDEGEADRCEEGGGKATLRHGAPPHRRQRHIRPLLSRGHTWLASTGTGSSRGLSINKNYNVPLL